MTYGPNHSLESFFNAPWVPEDKIFGYYLTGHNRRDEYEEFVVNRPDLDLLICRVAGWVEWSRHDLTEGDPLLSLAMVRE